MALGFGEIIACEFLLELLNAASGIYKALLAGIERMGARPYFHMQLRNGRSGGHDDLATEVDLRFFVVFGVDFVFHGQKALAKRP